MFHDFDKKIVVGKCFGIKCVLIFIILVELIFVVGNVLVGVYDIFAQNGIPAGGVLLILINIANLQVVCGLIRGLITGNLEDFPAYIIWKILIGILCAVAILVMWRWALPFVKREEDALFGTMEHIFIGATVGAIVYAGLGLCFAYVIREISILVPAYQREALNNGTENYGTGAP